MTNQLQSIAQNLRYDLNELRAIMSSIGKHTNLSEGSLAPEMEKIDRATILFACDTTGFQVVFYEIMQMLEAKEWEANQTVCAFLDPEYDQPLVMAYLDATLATDFSEDLRALWEPSYHVHQSGLHALMPLVPAFYASVVSPFLGLSFRRRLPSWKPLGRFFSTESGPSTSILGTGILRPESGADAVAPAAKKVEPADDKDAEAFQLMEQAEVEEEARAEQELDDSRIAYTLARHDDE